MKKSIATLAVTVYALTAQADTAVRPQHKPVYCAPFADLLKALTGTTYNEFPVWAAKDGQDRSRYVLFVNEKNKHWTLIQVWNTTGCILGAGTDSENISGQPRT